ncbi:hypothetical protein MASR1M32_24620 [Rhodobacter sp.]
MCGFGTGPGIGWKPRSDAPGTAIFRRKIVPLRLASVCVSVAVAVLADKAAVDDPAQPAVQGAIRWRMWIAA